MKKKKILIVEDNLEIALILKNQLTQEGYEITNIVDSGDKVIFECKNKPPDLILMDIILKGSLTGFEIASIIKNFFDIPIIFLTGNTTPNFIEEVKKSDAYGYLLKPVKKQDLIIAIEIALHKNEIDKKLKLNETLYKAVVEDQVDLITRYSPDLKLIFANKAFCEFYGEKRENLINKKITRFVFKNDINVLLESIKKLTVENPFSKIEHRVILKNREIRYLERIDRAIFLNNTLIEYQSVSRDITETKKSEELLKIQRDLSLKLIDNSISFEDKLKECLSFLLIITNFEKGIIYIFSEEKNDFYLAKAKGLSPDEIENSLYIEKDNPYYKYLLVQKPIYVSGKRLIDYTKELPLKNVKTLIILPLIFNQKRIANIILLSSINLKIPVYIKNILETLSIQIAQFIAYAKSEETLKQEKEILSTTLISISDGVISTNIKGEIILFNKASEIITGWKKEEAIGENIKKIFNIKEEKLSLDNIFENIIQQKKIDYYSYNSILLTKNEEIKNIEFSITPLKDLNKSITGITIVFKDITKKLILEEEIIKANKLEALGALAGGIAHDFNNYLTSILGNVSLAITLANDNTIKELLTDAIYAIEKSKAVSYQLLTFARGGSFIPEICEIKKIIENCLSSITETNNIVFKLEISDNLPSLEIDKEQISLVFKNIIQNAIDAMPQGGTITIRAEEETIMDQLTLPLKSGKYIKISIKDQGIGIPDEIKDKIFDPYFSLSQKRSGLGLPIAYSIIKKHNGLITFNSKKSKGSTFYIYLPVSNKITETAFETIKENEIKFGKGKILVMEDEEIVSQTIANMLKFLGYEYTLTKEGNETIKIYQESIKNNNPYDILLLDITIKDGLDGEKTIKELIKINPNVKAVAMSGYSNSPILTDYKKYGFVEALVKPYQLEKLSKTLNKIINKNDNSKE